MMELIQTDRGYKQKFFPGDTVDKLTVVKYLGKKDQVRYLPVYSCYCDCGNIENRTQRYLATKDIMVKSCVECARQRNKEGGRKGGSANRTTYTPTVDIEETNVESEEDVVKRVLMSEIFKFQFKPTFDPRKLISTERDIIQMERFNAS